LLHDVEAAAAHREDLRGDQGARRPPALQGRRSPRRLSRRAAEAGGGLSSPVRASPAEKTVVRFEIAPSTIGLILAAGAGVWLLSQLWAIGLLVVVALVFAGTFNPLIESMQKRGLGRTPALILLFCGSIAIAGLAIFFTVPPLLEQLGDIVRGAPAARAQLIDLLAKRSSTAPLAHVVQNAGLEEIFARIQSWLL